MGTRKCIFGVQLSQWLVCSFKCLVALEWNNHAWRFREVLSTLYL